MQTQRRRALGAWYTPDSLVDLAVESALAPLVADRTLVEVGDMRVLDPACGDGAFLRGVLRFFSRLPGSPRPTVCGVDVDPAAVREATASLGAAAEIVRADWLLPPGAAGRPWQAIVGNPPWVGVRSMPAAQRQALGVHYATAVGQFDLMAPFVERSLASLAPGGRASLLLPDRWLLNREGEPLRRLVVTKGRLLEVIRLGEDRFRGVNMPSLLAVLGPPATPSDGPPPSTVVRDGPQGAPRTFDLGSFVRWDQLRFPLHLSLDEVDRAERMASSGVALSSLVRNGRGVELGKRSPHVQDEPGPGFVPILFGEDIDRYHLGRGRHVRWGVKSVRYKDPSLYRGPKLLLRKTGVGVRAALDRSDRLVSQVVYVLTPRADQAAWLLGILNSASFQFLHRARNGEADKRVFPHLRQGDVLALPVPRPGGDGAREIAKLADQRMGETDERRSVHLDRAIDALVESAYSASAQ